MPDIVIAEEFWSGRVGLERRGEGTKEEFRVEEHKDAEAD